MIPYPIMDQFCQNLAKITDWRAASETHFVSDSNQLQVSVAKIENCFLEPGEMHVYGVSSIYLYNGQSWVSIASIYNWDQQNSLFTTGEMVRLNRYIMPSLQPIIQGIYNQQIKAKIDAEQERKDLLDEFLMGKLRKPQPTAPVSVPPPRKVRKKKRKK